MTTIIRTSFYYGPLEILLKWLLSKELDPFKIKISVLTDEFLNFYLKDGKLSFKESLEFLYALTFFLVYKTKALFDKPHEEEEEEGDEREKTVSFIEIIEFLSERYERMKKMYTREETETLDTEESFDPSVLFAVFSKLIQKLPEVKEKLPEIPRIEEKIKYILSLLEKFEYILFSKLILESRNKIEAIVTFLAILELIRIRKIRCEQERLFEDIRIYRRNLNI